MPELIKKELLEGHELDSILVTNPDIGCDFEETVITPHQDPYIYNHSEYFQVLWGGQPHRVKPGETRIMPRFLAKHFAKHLADHILTKMEEKTGKAGLMQSPTERPKVLATILLRVESFFAMSPETTEGQKVEKMVDELNPGEYAQNLGSVPDPALGVLKPEPISTEEIMKNAGVSTEEVSKVTERVTGKNLPEAILGESPNKTSIWDETKEKPTKKELILEANRLNIEITGKETVDQLISKIKSF